MVIYVESTDENGRQDDRDEESSSRASSFMSSTTTNSNAAKQLAEEQWNRAAAVLSARPSLLTPKILQLVLKNRPPAHVVEFLLGINPRCADIPKSGPTALHTALKYQANKSVIRVLLEACPLLLVATHDGYDVVQYCKRWRPDEPELVDLLNTPLSSWMNKKTKKQDMHKGAVLVVQHAASSHKSVLSPPSPPPTSPTSIHVATSPTIVLTEDSKKELDNIKMIATSIVRAQKRQTALLEQHKREMEESLQQHQSNEAQQRLHQLLELEKRQTDHFRTQLIALDMKEKRMMTKVRSMERRVVKAMELSKEVRVAREAKQQAKIVRLENMVKTFYDMMNEHQSKTEQRVATIEMRLEQECKMNDYFRSDTRLQLDQLDTVTQQRRDEQQFAGLPIVFATPKDELDDDDTLATEPLFSVASHNSKTHKKKYPNHHHRSNKRRPLANLLHF